MNQIWTEERIRNEIRLLDKKTGLAGAALPISFNNAKCTLGQFCINGNKKGSFKFSNHYYQDPEWPEEVAIETIRHEYAHYMDYELYGNLGHGSTWKACCRKIGIAAIRLYNDKEADYYRNKHKEQAEKNAILDKYVSGTRIEHPKYGKGEIKEISGTGMSRLAEVEFDDLIARTLSLRWISEKCRVCKDFPPLCKMSENL